MFRVVYSFKLATQHIDCSDPLFVIGPQRHQRCLYDSKARIGTSEQVQTVLFSEETSLLQRKWTESFSGVGPILGNEFQRSIFVKFISHLGLIKYLLILETILLFRGLPAIFFH